jgi:deoxyhypusine monooxygenase
MLGDDGVSIAKRSRLLWYLRHVHNNTEDGMGHLKKNDIIPVLEHGFKSQSALLKHEVAYVLGQLGNSSACELLGRVLGNHDEDCMVRHEAGEALGAIGNLGSVSLLERHLSDPLREIRETCELAIANIRFMNEEGNGGRQLYKDEFQSFDPAPPADKQRTTAQLREDYLNLDLPLFDRYRAMFALRNRVSVQGDLDALRALCEGFREEEGALFKHEVAFVLGQLQRSETSEILERILRDKSQHDMVRHEAAEALGSISDPKSLQLLEDYQRDEAPAVKDSCVVAVDMHNYWSQFTPSQD